MALVAIQTPHYAHNYGAQLQAYALGIAVKSLGYDIEYIDRRPPYYFEYANILDKWLKKIQLNTEGKGFLEFENLYLIPKSRQILYNRDYSFLDTTRYCAIIVGSDQIWRDDYFFHSFEYSPYLYFIKDKSIKKISYAASFGKDTCKHPEERRRKIEDLLHDFSAISVREISGINILKEVYHVQGQWVLDPTLLHKAEVYIENLGLSKKEINNNEIVTYILGASSQNMKTIDSLGKSMRISINHIYKRSTYWWMYKRPFSLLKRYKSVPSVFSWLDNILNAKYVFTDSFHGMVFCIIFKKQFIVMNNKAGGTERFTSLLDKLGLANRLCDWESSVEEVKELLFTPIDYEMVHTRLDNYRKDSYVFLKENLCNSNIK